MDPAGKPVTPAVLDETYTPAKAAYSDQGASTSLLLQAGP